MKEKKELSFEESILKLEEIVKKLESGECSLDESINEYTEGMRLAAFCGNKLNEATENINKILTEQGKLEDFDIPEN